MQPGPPFPMVVPLRHGGLRKWSWLCGIGGGHASRLITSHMWRRHGEHPQSSTGPKPRPGEPPAVACLLAQAPMLFSASLMQLLAGWVLSAAQCFLTLGPTGILPAFLRLLTLLSAGSPALSWCRVYLNERSALGPMLGLIPPQYFLLPLHHQGTCNCCFQALGFHCHGPRPHSFSSSGTSLLRLSGIFTPSSAGPGFLTPFPHAGNLPPLSPYTNLVNLSIFRPPIVRFFSPSVCPGFSSSWFSAASATT